MNIQRLNRIAEIIESVDNRCMAADGPVTSTLDEMTQDEMSEIYKLASTPSKREEIMRDFYISISCLLVEGPEFNSKIELYDAIKGEFKKFAKQSLGTY